MNCYSICALFVRSKCSIIVVVVPPRVFLVRGGQKQASVTTTATV